MNLDLLKQRFGGLFKKQNGIAPTPSEPPIIGERGIPQLSSGRKLNSALTKAGFGLGVAAAIGLAYHHSNSIAQASQQEKMGGHTDQEPDRKATSGATRFIVGDQPPTAPPAPSTPSPEDAHAQDDAKDNAASHKDTAPPVPPSTASSSGPAPKDEVRERRLKSGLAKQAAPEALQPLPMEAGIDPVRLANAGNQTGYQPTVKGSGGGTENDLASRLHGTQLAAASAYTLPDRTLMMTKGAYLDCALENALDSTLPGITRCVLARDVYGSDGKVVLLERGTKLVGEYQSNAKQGQARIFVLWTRAETPKGVLINLDSPGTDALGRSGVEGWVDTHFWERFGSAIMLSLIGDTLAAGSSGDRYQNSRAAAQSTSATALENTINIPPTIRKNHGDHIEVILSRDLDFRGVYALESHTY